VVAAGAVVVAAGAVVVAAGAVMVAAGLTGVLTRLARELPARGQRPGSFLVLHNLLKAVVYIRQLHSPIGGKYHARG
jgi:hypothetical protein